MRRISTFGTSTDDVAVAREITKEAYEKILIVASAISQVINVTTIYNSGILDSINNNINVINGVYNITEAINTLNNDIVAIESLFADKATLDSIYADKTVIDSLESIKDKLEYLYDNIDTLNVLYTDRTVWTNVFNYLNEINEVSLQLTSIEAVQNKLTEITQVYTSLNAIVSLYDNMIDINTVATVISDVIDVSNVSTDVSTVADNISTIINVYNSISNINTVASKITDINNFTAVWLGTFSTAPTTRTDASPLQLGDLYFNTTADSVKVYASTGWINAGSSVNGVASAIDYVATEGQTVFNSIYDTGYVFVWRNGFKLSTTDFTATDGTTITLTNPASNGDIISVLSFGSFSATDSSLMPFDPTDTGIASTNVEDAIKEVKNLVSNQNLLINSCGRINQRGYVSGTATTTANQYTLDRWRVVTSGQNLTFSVSENIVTFTAPAGGIEQVVEGLNLLTGTYTLSWEGTAIATVNGTTIPNGGNIALTGGANAVVRFTGGTFRKPKLERGKTATEWNLRNYSEERCLCLRYFLALGGTQYETIARGGTSEAGVFYANVIFNQSMRVAPSLSYTGTFLIATGNSTITVTSLTTTVAVSADSLELTATVSGTPQASAPYKLRADSVSSRVYINAEY